MQSIRLPLRESLQLEHSGSRPHVERNIQLFRRERLASVWH